MEFLHPEKITTTSDAVGSTTYYVGLQNEHRVGPLRWSRTGLHPELSQQDAIDRLKNEVLEGLVKNRAMFRTPPSLSSLRTISPAWGFVVLGTRIEWSGANIWAPEALTDLANKEATLHAVLKGVQISRQAIRPVWKTDVLQVLPDQDPMDLDFGEEEGDVGSDISSVASFEIDTADVHPFHLRDRAARKRQVKAEVRQTIARAVEARMAADAAMDRFYEEFDLSEGESDFSDSDDV
jgi:hypothetical protein